MSSTHSPADVLTKQQRAILLHQLAHAKNGELPLTKAIKPPAWAAKQLALTPETAAAVLDSLIAEQLVAGSAKGKTKKVAITQAGREALERLAEFVPQPPPKKEKKPRAPKKSLAEQTAEKVRAQAAKLGDKPVSFKPPGGKNPKPEAVAAFEQTVKDLIAEGKLYEHPGGKYGTRPVPTPAEVVRTDVQTKLDTAEGPFKPADLSKPTRGASAEEQQAHADALATVIVELVAAKKLFPHPGGKYGQLPHVEPDFVDRELREVYILDQFFRAPNHTITAADIELAFPGKGKPKLKELETKYKHVARFRGQGCFEMGAPATRQTLEQLVASGDLRADEKGEAYSLTAAGAERLKQARASYPVLPPVGVPATPDDAAMRETWEAFVLLRLAEATDLTGGEAVVFAGGYPKGSKLNEATAWVLYGELAKAGHVTARWNGSEGEYTLTPQGLRHLAGLSFDGLDKLILPGRTLTALLSAARSGPTSAPAPATTTATPSAADLEAAVMDIFYRLLRERHANDTRVPIHEVRAEVARSHGSSYAAHDTFDPVLNRLDKAGKIRLVEIDDRGRATMEQLQDSIHVSSGTLFFMKRVDYAH